MFFSQWFIDRLSLQQKQKSKFIGINWARKRSKMKSARSVRLITDVIQNAKRTTTTTTVTAKAAAAEQLNYYEPRCPHAVAQNENILSNSSSSMATTTTTTTATAIIDTPFTYDSVRPYSEVPGPKPLPLLGNTWR